MKDPRFVYQDRVGPSGNCFSACLASVFKLPLQAVPNFFDVAGEDHEAWWAEVRAWLKPRGFGIMSVSITADSLKSYSGLFIVGGMSPRDLNHATVWQDGVMVHDPHPEELGLTTIESIDLLYPLDPADLAMRHAA
jgi:hypothetical protein